MREPDIQGTGAKAWRPTLPNEGPADWNATLECFLVHQPGVNMAWSWWQCAVIHLRDIPGVKSAHRQYLEAEYEIMFLALDPRHSVDPDKPHELHFLTPVDLVEQFHGVTDDQARELLRGCVRLICDGRAAADSDYRSFWRECIRNTLQHMITGGHAAAKT